MQELEGNQKSVIDRLEVIRQLNKKRGWINQDLFRLLFKPDLYEIAYERIKSEPGNMTPGTDDETLDGFSKDEIIKLIQEMKTETYIPRPVRTAYIPKANGKMRKLGIPSVRDKIVQEVLRMILEAIYDSPHGAYFSELSHGFRRSRSTHTALKEVQGKWSGMTWLVEGDIKACFDDIDHAILIKIIKEKIHDERFTALIWKILKAGYMDMKDGGRKDSLAGTPQGGIVSPILANIYLDKLDQFVEGLRKELDNGKHRKHNLQYKRLQDQRLYLAKQGKTKTQRFEELGRQMKKLPSTDMYDPDFIRVKFIRYADDFVVGVIGSHSLAEDIKERIATFLNEELKLTLSKEKTVITNARTQEAKFLGYRIKIGTVKEQKQAKVRNGSGKEVKKRTTGMQVVLKAPLDEVVKRLHTKGFCDKNGYPIHKAPWTLLDEDQIVMLYSSINRGILQYYRPVDNWARLQRAQYILKYSLAKTLASKRKSTTSRVISGKDVSVTVHREGKPPKEVTFYQNHEWSTNRAGFSHAKNVDIVAMNVRLRTRSKLGLPCCICGEPEGVQMHHVRHIRKMTDKQAKGFTRVLAMLNRKQIPVCKRCHRLIHSGAYDKMSLKDLAYDPRWANTTRPPKIKAKINPSEEQSKEEKAKSGIQVPGHLETDTKQVQNV
jgi:group II intron reverse transcriptase/maturase